MAGHWHQAQTGSWGALAAAVAVTVVTCFGLAGAAVAAELPPVPTTLTPVTVPKITVPPATFPPLTVPVTVPKVNLSGPAPVTVPLRPGSKAPASPAVTGVLAPAPVTAPSPSPAPSGVGPSVDGRPTPTPTGVSVPSVEKPLVRRALPFRLLRAAAETVQQMTFPVALALATLGFLVFQHRVDEKDPRVAPARFTDDDEVLGFS